MQFSIIIKPLFESFKGMVSTSSLEELHRTALSWLDQHCSLPILRPSEWGPVGAKVPRGLPALYDGPGGRRALAADGAVARPG